MPESSRIRARGAHPGDSEQLEVTVLMSDIRGFSTINEHTDPSLLVARAAGITAYLLFGAMLIGLMAKRPQGLLGKAAVEII